MHNARVIEDRPEDSLDVPPRESVGGYALGEVLGRGGMGVVYRAVGPDGRVVALKTLLGNTIRSGAERARFQREAQIRIDHPNVIEIVDAGVDGELPWIALELLEGDVLSDVLTRGRLAPAEVLTLGIAAAEGLAAAHRVHVIHRDLKPSNLFICSDGALKIIDFGIAHLGGDHTRLTATGSVLGTPTYLSPEQANGVSSLDARTDVWSLGGVLYQALAGRPAFERSTPLATILAVMIEQAPPLTLVAPRTPPSLAAVVSRCLEKNPEDRYSTAAELLAALQEIDPDEVGRVGGEGEEVAASAVTSPSEHSPSITPGEQRVVAVLFADGMLNRTALAVAIEQAGGTFIPVMGDRAIGLFGGKAWEGDEVERAARAALDARAAARYMAVASGRATHSGSTGIAGSALVTAERACAARVQGIAIDAASARALSSLYAIKKLEGGEYEITDRVSEAPPSTLPPPQRLRTVGRAAELAQLATACRAVRDESRAVTVLVTGPPGIGKSHLRWELEQLIEDEANDHDEEPYFVLSARANLGRRGVGLDLWGAILAGFAAWGTERHGWPRLYGSGDLEVRRQAVRRITEAAMGPGPTADETAIFFGALLGVDMPPSAALEAARQDPRLMQDRLRLGIMDWLAALAEGAPVAVILEDIHWADEGSRSLVEDIGEQLADSPILFFLTARPQLIEDHPEFLAGAASQKLTLGGLRGPDIEKLIPVFLGGKSLPPETTRLLAERSAGNPLFVEQIALALLEEGRLGRPIDELPLPLTVEAAVQSRLDHLSTEEKALSKRAALFSRPFAADDLAALGLLDTKAQLVSLTRRDIFASRSRPGPPRRREYRFRSGIVRDVAYRMMARALRDDLHLRLAEHLATTDEAAPEEVAQHYEYAGRTNDAASWYRRAANAAADLGDAPRVLASADQALALGVPSSQWFELQMARGDALEFLGRLEQQGEALGRALDAAVDDTERARALTNRGVCLFRLGQQEEALRVAAEAVAKARAADVDDVFVTARGRQAVLLAYSQDQEAARSALAEARGAAPEGRQDLRTSLSLWSAQVASVAGDLAERRAAYQATVDGYTAAGDLRRVAGAEMNLADLDNRIGEYEAAEVALGAAAAKCRRIGSHLMEGYALANQGYSLIALGRQGDARAVLEAALAIGEDSGETRLAVAAGIYLARTQLDLPGESEGGPETGDALAGARRAAAAAAEAGLEGLHAMGLTGIAEIALAAGQVDVALESSLAALSLRDRLGGLEEGEAELFLARASALEAAGRNDEAREVRLRGRARILEIADGVGEEMLRRSFLTNVFANCELVGSHGAGREEHRADDPEH